jgi:signal transduction histidine kinase
MQQPSSSAPVPHVADSRSAEPRLPRLTGWLRPAVDAVARVRLTIHQKLLIGFLTGALLLVCMAVLSLVVISKMNERMSVLTAQAQKVDLAQQMLYDVTAQSHYRAMALLNHRNDPTDTAGWNQKVDDKKAQFAGLLAELKAADKDPLDRAFYMRLSTANQKYARASAQVLAAYQQRHFGVAKRWHLTKEHPASHVLEDLLANCDTPAAENACFPQFGAPFIDVARQEMAKAGDNFQSDRRLLRTIVIAFSAVSVLTALVLGFLLSWAFLLPVKKMQVALAQITAGDLGHRIQVPNRDEFGKLAADLNGTNERLLRSFRSQRGLEQRLRESNASLARASEAKSRFLASVSHELRTPMNAILGFTDALLAGVDGPLNDEQRESLGWVQRGGRDLLGLINEILDLSKIEAGRLVLDLQPFDPKELVESVVAQHRSLAAKKGIGFHWRDSGAPGEVILDRQRVRQIVVNLVGNALKFTREGHVEVEVGTIDSDVEVIVRDTGPGIDPGQHEAVFEEFRQLGADHVGTGLGLAISRRLARAMSGDVTVESQPQRGSVFRLRLPVDSRGMQAKPVHADEPELSYVGERLLLSVDDDPSVAPLLQKMLAGSGYRVVAAQDARTVASDVRRLRPAAILLDLLMQERAGEDVLRELKTEAETSDIPVIVVSVVDAADGPALADGHIRKPVDKVALQEALSGLGIATVER